MAQEVAENETYVDGLASPSIKIRRRRMIDLRPCGVYATNKRIFLVRSSIWMQITYITIWLMAVILLLSGLVISDIIPLVLSRSLSDVAETPFLWLGLALLFIFIGSSWYKNFSKVPIQDLEKRKIWEIDRGQISSTAETSASIFSKGEITIHLKSGETRSIFFYEKGSYNRTKLLFSRFV